jgi:hypothetical protein
MKICCGRCQIPLKDDDLLVLDEFNTLKHRGCYELGPDYIKDVDTFKNIKEKYDFLREAFTH